MADTLYAASKELIVFPITYDRSSDYYNGRVLTEQNLSTLIEKLSNRKSYVIDYTPKSSIEFMIKGHYFNLTDKTLLSKLNLYVKVKLDSSVANFTTLEISDTAKGVEEIEFSESEFTNTETSSYTLHLLENIGTEEEPIVQVPVESFFRFDKNVIKSIDGGTI